MSKNYPVGFGFGTEKREILSVNTYFHASQLNKKIVKIGQEIHILWRCLTFKWAALYINFQKISLKYNIVSIQILE